MHTREKKVNYSLILFTNNVIETRNQKLPDISICNYGLVTNVSSSDNLELSFKIDHIRTSGMLPVALYLGISFIWSQSLPLSTELDFAFRLYYLI